LKIVDLWQLIPSSFMISVFPVLTSYCHAQGGEKILVIREKSIKYLLAISLPIAAGLFVAARPVLQRLYGAGFESSVAVLRVLVLTIPLVSLWAVLWRVLSARGEHGAAFGSQVVSLLVRFALGYVLIRSFASVGAAISATVAMLVLDLLLVYQVQRDGSRLRILRLAGRSALATASMAVVTLLLRDHLKFWVVVSVSAAAYITMMVVLKTFSEDDFTLFRSVWRVENT
jgi:O-antigen/teichoic acid export membrane protein